MRYTVALPAGCGGEFTRAAAIAEMALAIEQAGFEEAAELAEIGVTWLALRLPAPDRAAFLRNVERLGSQIAS